MAPPKSPNCTPHLTSSERSPSASVSKAATPWPTAFWPPYSIGYPMAVSPCDDSSRAQARTFSRCSSIGRSSTGSLPGCDSQSRTFARTSAYSPSSRVLRVLPVLMIPRLPRYKFIYRYCALTHAALALASVAPAPLHARRGPPREGLQRALRRPLKPLKRGAREADQFGACFASPPPSPPHSAWPAPPPRRPTSSSSAT